MMHTPINRATSSAISDGVIPEIQNVIGIFTFGTKGH